MQKSLLKPLFQMGTALFFMAATPQVEALVYVPYDSHLAADIYPESCLLTFEDGSEWKVSDFDQGELFSWYVQGTVVPVEVTPNYFSTRYTYYLTNQSTGSYVRANLVGAPFRDSPYALTITGLDLYNRGAVYLSNGTFWHISSFDVDAIRNWYMDDLVILGKNTEWFSFNTHILINIHTNTFVRAQRL